MLDRSKSQVADNAATGKAEKTAIDAASGQSPIPLGVSKTQGGLSIHRDPIPPPSSYLVNFRTWRPVKMEVRSLNAQEAFMIWMKAGFISGIVVASPWIFWQVWQFVAAGLYPHEKNYVYMYLPFSLLLFLAGAGMAFFFVFEPVLDFLFSFNKALNIDPDPRISEWLGFVLILPLGFGISFQLPLVMLFINRLGLVSLATYLEKWRIAILAIFVISSILTPADPISIFLMAIPLTLLYFLGMGLCKWMPQIRNPYAETAEAM
jgi:sec-independent protein translocase protein TatC